MNNISIIADILANLNPLGAELEKAPASEDPVMCLDVDITKIPRTDSHAYAIIPISKKPDGNYLYGQWVLYNTLEDAAIDPRIQEAVPVEELDDNQKNLLLQTCKRWGIDDHDECVTIISANTDQSTMDSLLDRIWNGDKNIDAIVEATKEWVAADIERDPDFQGIDIDIDDVYLCI